MVGAEHPAAPVVYVVPESASSIALPEIVERLRQPSSRDVQGFDVIRPEFASAFFVRLFEELMGPRNVTQLAKDASQPVR